MIRESEVQGSEKQRFDRQAQALDLAKPETQLRQAASSSSLRAKRLEL
jgi:hypothetical protein